MFRPSWQVVCHVNDIPKPGDYHTFDFLNEAIIVIRGDDGVVRAFHNVCRHRASRLVDGPSGHCNVRLTCRYHAWSYDLRGNLAGIPFRETFVALDPAAARAQAGAARDLSRLHLRPSRRQRAVGRRDDGAVRKRDRGLPHGRAGAARPRHAAPARGELEEHRRQLFRFAAHQCRASGPDAAVRQGLRHRGARLGRQDVGHSARPALGQPLRAHVSAGSAEGAASAGGPAAAVGLFQALAQCRLRHLSRPGRLHAVPAADRDHDHDPRDRLCASGLHAAR